MQTYSRRVKNGPWASLLGLAIVLGLPLAGAAQDAQVLVQGAIGASDLQQGSGNALNASGWQAIRHALAGSGNQAAGVHGNANTGPGSLQAARVEAQGWAEMTHANAGTGVQLLGSTNANGHDRVSNDSVLLLAGASEVTHTSLRSAVAQSSVFVAAPGGSANSNLWISGQSLSSGFYGVQAIVLAAGANASQNVSINVVGSAVRIPSP